MLSLARGLSVMRALAEHGPRLSTSEVARLTGLSRAAAGRCLHTLVVTGYASSIGSTWELAPAVISLASPYLAASSGPLGSASIARVAQPVLEQLADRLHESSSLAVLDGDNVIYLARAAARRILSIELAVGSRLPATCTSMGRVLLASIADGLLTRFLDRVPLEAHTPLTIIDKAELRAELARVRVQGFAIVDQELELGLRSIAVPVRRKDGMVIAAINAGVHVARANTEALRLEFLPALQRASAAITAAIG
jgi:IclR family pca regulon transcriptional regulator